METNVIVNMYIKTRNL